MAINALKKEFQGRKIRVDYSLTKKAHSPTPGRYMGREKTMRRSYRPGSYGDYSYQGSHDRYNHRERRERDRSADSHDRSYNDRPPNPPSHEDRWDDRREMYPSRSAMRSADSAGNDWRNDESENYK